MGVEDRKREILEKLNAHNGVASIHYLVGKLYSSRSTIRRDLIALEEDGVLKRSHGYVSLVTTSARSKIWKRNKKSQKESTLLSGTAWFYS